MAAIHWFRKGLRLHDNPALVEACSKSLQVYPVFVLDPFFANPDYVGVNRYSFLLQSLDDLDHSLRKLGSRLYVVLGKPLEQLPRLVGLWRVSLLTFESDIEPYALKRDDEVTTALQDVGVQVSQHTSHTLFPPQKYVQANGGSAPNVYGAFVRVFAGLGEAPREPVERPSTIPGVVDNDDMYNVPSLTAMGYKELPTTSFMGGESEALRRLKLILVAPVVTEKPPATAATLEPSQLVLSPYLKFGCISPARVFYDVAPLYPLTSMKGLPPIGLHWQLLWREFYYAAASESPRFDKMEGNSTIKQIPWERDEAKIRAWKEGRTGYPFIDAAMTQLRLEGWIHGEARLRVACFLTRGDLWQHWEEGAKVFDLYLLDADWALNNGNWLWISCSRFETRYFRVFNPVFFASKADPKGEYAKKWLPALKNFPSKYIYEPWTAPELAQMICGCIVGRDYPAPMVDHEDASGVNLTRMKQAVEDGRKSAKSEKKQNRQQKSGQAMQASTAYNQTIYNTKHGNIHQESSIDEPLLSVDAPVEMINKAEALQSSSVDLPPRPSASSIHSTSKPASTRAVVMHATNVTSSGSTNEVASTLSFCDDGTKSTLPSGPVKHESKPGFKPRALGAAVPDSNPALKASRGRTNHIIGVAILSAASFVVPIDCVARSSAMMAAIKVQLDAPQFSEFKECLSSYQQNTIKATELVQKCSVIFRKNLLRTILPELIALMPDITKQHELCNAYVLEVESDTGTNSSERDLLEKTRASSDTPVTIKRSLTTCPECAQLLLPSDVMHHQDHHRQLEFPTLGSSSSSYKPPVNRSSHKKGSVSYGPWSRR